MKSIKRLNISLLACSIMICMLATSCQEKEKSVVDVDETPVSTWTDRISNDENVVVIDVRTPEEMENGVIPGALKINFHDADFEAQIGALDKQKTYVVYCRSGGRAGKTCDKMKKLGFDNLYNYGGYERWLKEGK